MPNVTEYMDQLEPSVVVGGKSKWLKWQNYFTKSFGDFL